LQEDGGHSKVSNPDKPPFWARMTAGNPMSLDPDKSKRPSRSPEVKKKRNLSFFICVLAAIAYAAWQISQSS